jgi:hypothetical protein
MRKLCNLSTGMNPDVVLFQLHGSVWPVKSSTGSRLYMVQALIVGPEYKFRFGLRSPQLAHGIMCLFACPTRLCHLVRRLAPDSPLQPMCLFHLHCGPRPHRACCRMSAECAVSRIIVLVQSLTPNRLQLSPYLTRAGSGHRHRSAQISDLYCAIVAIDPWY